MPKKRRIISIPNSGTYAPQATGGGTYKQMSNTRSRHQVKSLVASSIQIHYANGTQGDTDANLPTTLSVQSSLRAYSSSPSGAFTSPGTLTIPKGQKARTNTMALSLTAGQIAEICTFADAGTGKCPPNTTYVQPAWTFGTPTLTFPAWGAAAFGDSLTPNLDGTLADATVNTVSTYTAYHPLALSGITATKAVAFLGHSLVRGGNSNYEVGFASYAGLQAGVATYKGGVGGSGIGGWAASVDRSNLDLAEVVVVLWSINDINNAVLASTTPSAFVASQTTAHTNLIRDLKSMGKKVMLCTEGPCGDMITQTTAAHLAMLQAWNAQVRSVGVSTMGADQVFDVANVLFTSISPDSGALKSQYETDLGVSGERIHWGNLAHYDVGIALGTALTNTGWLGEDDTTWTENYRETFDGTATAGGSFGRWTYRDYYSKNIFPLSGKGSLGVTTPAGGGVFAAYLSDNTTGFTQGRLELNFTFGGTAFTNDGFGVGFCTQDFVGGRFYLDGYIVYARAGDLRLDIINSANSNPTQIGIATYSTTPTSGRMCRLVFDMKANATAGRDLTCTMYYGSTAIATISVTGNTATSISSATLYPCIMYMGVGIGGYDPATRDGFAHTFTAYDYTAAAPASITAVSTLNVEKGGSRPISILVSDSGGLPMAGVAVSATSGATGTATIGSTVVTNGSGVALFDGSNAAVVPNTATVGNTATLTFTAGAITKNIVVTVVSAGSLGSGGGSGSSNGMRIGI